jgi:hypothetical protein
VNAVNPNASGRNAPFLSRLIRSSCLIGWGLVHLATPAAPADERLPDAEAAGVATEVLANADWRALASRCPASLMPKQPTSDYLSRNNCKPGEFKACQSRCTRGESGACYWLSYGLQQGGADPRAAEVLYQRSCQLGIVSGCTNRAAGMSLDNPGDEGIQTCAVETFSKACELDDPWACTMHALHLIRGIGTRPDKELALKALEKSCKYGPDDEACSAAISMKKSLLAPPEDGGRPK